MERALEALGMSQMEFDLDGARWERAVITACKASGAEVPEIVRIELISNHHRTKVRRPSGIACAPAAAKNRDDCENRPR
jgi:hypothetical protein